MAKNLILDPVLACLTQILIPQKIFQVLPLLVVRHCSRLSFYGISRKTNEPNIKQLAKNLNLGLILTHLAKFGPPNYSCGFYLYLLLDTIPSYHSMQFKGKLINQT